MADDACHRMAVVQLEVSIERRNTLLVQRFTKNGWLISMAVGLDGIEW